MPTEVIVRAVPGGLVAANGVEADKLDQFRGREMMVKISQPRNLQFHRKYFALLGAAYELADTDLTTEQFRKYCTIGAGYSTQIANGDEVYTIPDSISFAKMSDDRFERLYQDTITFICGKWVIDPEQLNQIAEFM